MRKHGLGSLLVFLVAIPAAFAQQPNQLSVFLSNPWIGYGSPSGVKASSGIGLSFARMFTPRVSAQLAVASEAARTYPYIVTTQGDIASVTSRSFHVYPVDLTVRYHFLNDTRWKPFLGLGDHYVGAPNVGSEFGYRNHLGGLLIGGSEFQIGRSFGLLLDGRAVFGKHEPYDVSSRVNVGFNWRF